MDRMVTPFKQAMTIFQN